MIIFGAPNAEFLRKPGAFGVGCHSTLIFFLSCEYKTLLVWHIELRVKDK